MNIVLNQGYPDYVGQRGIWCGYANGPASYTTGGESLAVSLFKYYIDSVDSGYVVSVSGNYWGTAIPSAVGPRATWKFIIYAAGGTTQVTASTDLSAEQFVLSGKGGLY